MTPMIKDWKYGKIIILAGVFVALITSLAFISCQQNDPEIGTWINQKNKKSEWVFTEDGKTKWYYNNKLFEIFTYKFTNEPPDCGEQIKKGKYFSFLQLTNVKDTKDQRCYYVNGLTDSTLSIQPFGHYTILFFKKSK